MFMTEEASVEMSGHCGIRGNGGVPARNRVVGALAGVPEADPETRT